MSFWKRAICQTESKALEKSIEARIVPEPSLDLSEADPKWAKKGTEFDRE